MSSLSATISIFVHSHNLQYFQPLNYGALHWYCLAIHPAHQTIYLLDPLLDPQYTTQIAAAFESLLHRLRLHTWRIATLSAKLQDDDYNCGMWAVWLSQQWQSFHMQPGQTPGQTTDFTEWVKLQHGSLHSVHLSPGDWLRRWYSRSVNEWRCASEGPFSAPSSQGPPHKRPRPGTKSEGRSSIDVTTPNNETAPGSAERLVHGHLGAKPTAHEEDGGRDVAEAGRDEVKPQVEERNQVEGAFGASRQATKAAGSQEASPTSPGKQLLAKFQKTPGSATVDAHSCLSILTRNVMGFTTIVDELQQIISEHEPDFIVLTETKFVKQQHGKFSIKKPFMGMYKLFCSSVLMPDHKGKQIGNRDNRSSLHERSGSGGVLMAIHMRWQPDAFAKLHAHDREPHLASHVVGVTMSSPRGLCYDIWGVHASQELRTANYIQSSENRSQQTPEHHARRLECRPSSSASNASRQRTSPLPTHPCTDGHARGSQANTYTSTNRPGFKQDR